MSPSVFHRTASCQLAYKCPGAAAGSVAALAARPAQSLAANCNIIIREPQGGRTTSGDCAKPENIVVSSPLASTNRQSIVSYTNSVPSVLKKLLKYAVPDSLLRWRNRLVVNSNYRRYADLTTREVFSMVYRSRDWGSSATGGFYSGHGSHDHTVVDPYVQKVGEFLQLLGRNPRCCRPRMRRFCGWFKN